MKFENTVTLGNLLTALSMLLAGAAAYANMNDRITKVEQMQIAAREANARDDAYFRDFKVEIKSSMSDIRSEIKELRLDLKQGSKR